MGEPQYREAKGQKTQVAREAHARWSLFHEVQEQTLNNIFLRYAYGLDKTTESKITRHKGTKSTTFSTRVTSGGKAAG